MLFTIQTLIAVLANFHLYYSNIINYNMFSILHPKKFKNQNVNKNITLYYFQRVNQSLF